MLRKDLLFSHREGEFNFMGIAQNIVAENPARKAGVLFAWPTNSNFENLTAAGFAMMLEVVQYSSKAIIAQGNDGRG